MKRFWSQPLRRQLFIAIILLLAPVLAAAVWSGVATYRESVQELGDQTRVIALTTAGAIDRELTGYDRMAANVSANAVLLDFDPVRVKQLMDPQTTQRPSLLEMIVATHDGTLVARSGVQEIPRDLAAVAAELARADKRLLSDMQVAPSGQRYVMLAYPIKAASGQIVALLVCHVNPQRLQDLFDVLPVPPGSVVSVTDARGLVLVRSLAPERYLGTVQSGQLPGAQPRPPQEREGLDGVSRMYGEARIGGGPWLASVGIPTSVALDTAMALWTRSFTILAIGLAGWLLIALFFSRRLTQSLSHLDQLHASEPAGAPNSPRSGFRPEPRRPVHVLPVRDDDRGSTVDPGFARRREHDRGVPREGCGSAAARAVIRGNPTRLRRPCQGRTEPGPPFLCTHLFVRAASSVSP